MLNLTRASIGHHRHGDASHGRCNHFFEEKNTHFFVFLFKSSNPNLIQAVATGSFEGGLVHGDAEVHFTAANSTFKGQYHKIYRDHRCSPWIFALMMNLFRFWRGLASGKGTFTGGLYSSLAQGSWLQGKIDFLFLFFLFDIAHLYIPSIYFILFFIHRCKSQDISTGRIAKLFRPTRTARSAYD